MFEAADASGGRVTALPQLIDFIAVSRPIRGRLFFGTFLLAKQKKGTRHRRKLLKPASGKLENTIRFHGYPQKQKSAAMPTTGPANDQYWQVANHHDGKLR